MRDVEAGTEHLRPAGEDQADGDGDQIVLDGAGQRPAQPGVERVDRWPRQAQFAHGAVIDGLDERRSGRAHGRTSGAQR